VTSNLVLSKGPQTLRFKDVSQLVSQAPDLLERIKNSHLQDFLPSFLSYSLLFYLPVLSSIYVSFNYFSRNYFISPYFVYFLYTASFCPCS